MQYHKYLIIGAGPGGIQMGHFLQEAGLDYLILEARDSVASFFSRLPVHRRLISINKKYNYFEEEEFNMRHDWNSLLSERDFRKFTEYSDELYPKADDLQKYLSDFAEGHDLNLRFGACVEGVERTVGGDFCVRLQGGETIQCAVLLAGTGPLKPAVPGEIEGIELATNYADQETDPAYYRNKRVCVIGQGNSAFETAEALSATAAFVHVFVKDQVRMAWETHFVGDLRAVNNGIFDMYQLKSLHAVLNPRLRSIRATDRGTFVTSHEYDYPDGSPPGTLELTREYDVIINCTGWSWAASELFSEDCMPDVCELGKFPAVSPIWESNNVPDLFFIGSAMQGNDRQAASGFIHGFRYNIRTLAKFLQERYEGRELLCEKFHVDDWDAIFEKMYGRFSVSAALFQLYGVLCDVLTFSKENDSIEWVEELPLNHVRETFGAGSHVLTLTLEFGFDKFTEPSITFMGPSDPTNSDCVAFLHPVVRHRFRGVESEFHFPDSLLGRWDRPHAGGGAVEETHQEFVKWLEGKIGVPVSCSETAPAKNFRVWEAATPEKGGVVDGEIDGKPFCRRPEQPGRKQRDHG